MTKAEAVLAGWMIQTQVEKFNSDIVIVKVSAERGKNDGVYSNRQMCSVLDLELAIDVLTMIERRALEQVLNRCAADSNTVTT